MSEELRTAHGGRIDRSRALEFTFDGVRYRGFAGDTLASALLANGVHLLGRSFKYHRPRGVLAAGAEEPNALVGVRRDAARYTPNVRATQLELYEGLEVESQNRWPSLAFDVGAINDLIAPFIPAGFYYKTFMWPRRAWKSFYEPRIRAAAGLGVAPRLADPDRYAARYAHCDVLVVGAGPAGLAAAAAAAATGARVMLCDEQSEPGGTLLSRDPREPARIDARSPDEWLDSTLAALAANRRVTLLPRTTAFGYFPHNLVSLNERLTDHLPVTPPEWPRERRWLVRAREVVLATGAIERPLVFPGNDRPGIMLASAARTFLNRYAVRPGSRVVLVTATDEAYAVALELQRSGVFVAMIADVRPGDSGAASRAREARIPVLAGATVLGTNGRRRVSAIHLAQLEGGVPTTTQLQPAIWCSCQADTPRACISTRSRAASFSGTSGCRPSSPARLASGCAAWVAAAECWSLPLRSPMGPPRVPLPRGLRRIPPDGVSAPPGLRPPRRLPQRGHPGQMAEPAGSAMPCPARAERVDGRSSTGRTMSPHATWRSPRAKDSIPSSTSSATPPRAWRRTRARPPI